MTTKNSAPTIEPMSTDEIEKELSKLPGWSLEENRLVKTFRFKAYEEAISFVVRVALHAEKINHHPELICNFDSVRVGMNTHDAGDMVTEKDLGLARRIQQFDWTETNS